jgi:hypothetical protein
MNKELETSGVLKISYNLDNTGYQDYSASINVIEEGRHTLKFFSTDKAGNNEIEQYLDFTIDKTTPELKMTFDINSKDVIFEAQDIIDSNPTMITNRISVISKDFSGNIIMIPFVKYKDSPRKLRFIYNKIIRNGVVTQIPNTNIIYDWKEKKGTLTDLDTRVVIRGIEKYVFNYKKVTNTTIIKIKTDSGIITTTQPGFVVVTVKTEADGLDINY